VVNLSSASVGVCGLDTALREKKDSRSDLIDITKFIDD
jgi:hypothetical protein